MSDDLIKRLRDAADGPYDMTPICAELLEAITCIKELQRERDVALAAQSYSYIGKDMQPILARDLEDAKDAAEAKLAKAMEALQKIADHPYSWRTLARKTLAELEAKK